MARRALFSREIAKSKPLPAIPVIETGADFSLATLEAWAEKPHALRDAAGRRYPNHLLVGLDKVSRSRAWLKGRDYATPDDVQAVVSDVFRHRLILSYEAHASNTTPDQVIERIVGLVAVS